MARATEWPSPQRASPGLIPGRKGANANVLWAQVSPAASPLCCRTYQAPHPSKEAAAHPSLPAGQSPAVGFGLGVWTGAALAVPSLSLVMEGAQRGLPLLPVRGSEEPADARTASSLSSDLSAAAAARWVLILARMGPLQARMRLRLCGWRLSSWPDLAGAAGPQHADIPDCDCHSELKLLDSHCLQAELCCPLLLSWSPQSCGEPWDQGNTLGRA